MEFVNDLGKRLDSVLENKTTSLVISLVLVLYAGLAAPALPNSVIKFFDTMLGQVIFLFLIGFLASRNVQVALMIAVAYVVTLHIANKRATEEYINFLRNEQFENYYELFKDDPVDTKTNRAMIVPLLCEHVKEANKASADDKQIMRGGKLMKDHANLTVGGFFEKVKSSKTHSMDKFVEKAIKLKLKKLKKKDSTDLEDMKEDKKADYLRKFMTETLKDEKLAKLCDLKVEEFMNYESFEEGPTTEEEAEYFENGPTTEEEAEYFEDGPGAEEDAELFDGEEEKTEEFEEGEDDAENFYEDMEEFQNFNVVPADNLAGNSAKMYAPVKFE